MKLLNKNSMVFKIFRAFARNKIRSTLPLSKEITKNIDSQIIENNNMGNITFDNMDVEQLQTYIDEANNHKKAKELNMEMLKKLEAKSAKQYLQKAGVFTKAELKELTDSKYLQINKKKIDSTTLIDPSMKIELKVKNPEKFILPSNMKLFLFFKPKNIICTKTDPKGLNRPTIFDYIRSNHKIKDDLFCIVK